MAIDDDVFRAILAMDSYHRGGDGLGLDGAALGTASVDDNSNDLEVIGSSFFAQSYTWQGRTAISYRGTDNIWPTCNRVG